MDDEGLARALLAASSETIRSDELTRSFMSSRVWAQAGIQVVCLMLDEGRTPPTDLLREVVSRWRLDMGPVLAERFTAALDDAA